MKTDDYMTRVAVTMERVFDAPAAKVFRAWTDPELMSRWMWASLSNEVWAESDLRVGGAYRVYTKFEGGHDQGEGWSGMCGLYTEIVPDRKLVYTLHWDANVGYNQGDALAIDEVMSVTFTPDGDRTRVVWSHFGIPDDGQSAPTHQVGDEQSLDLLAATLSSL